MVNFENLRLFLTQKLTKAFALRLKKFWNTFANYIVLLKSSYIIIL